MILNKLRFEILNDGPSRYVVLDNWSDDPAPVFERRAAAEEHIQRQYAEQARHTGMNR